MERNTYDRIRLLMERGVLEKNFGRDLLEAYRFLNMLRFREQADNIIKGKEPDNYINPEKISKQEKGLLKDAFRVVENFQEFLRHSFGSVLLE